MTVMVAGGRTASEASQRRPPEIVAADARLGICRPAGRIRVYACGCARELAADRADDFVRRRVAMSVFAVFPVATTVDVADRTWNER